MKNEFHGKRNPWGSFAGKSLITLALVFCLIITTPFLSNAAEISDAKQSCSLTVNAASDEEFRESLENTDMVIDLYKVASALPMPSGSGYSYDMLSAYAGLEIEKNMDSKKWHALSQGAANIALNTNAGNKNLIREGVDIQNTPIEDLEPGIYLLIARNDGAEDYIATTTEGNIVTKVHSGEYTYTFLPELVAVPGWDSVTEEWQYDAEIFLKPERDTPYGSLKIIKTLRGNDAGSGSVTFVFDVEAVLDGKRVYSNVVSIAFQKPGVEELLIEKIPIGAEVTVTEVYSGARCSLVSDKTRTVKIETDKDVPSVAFTNEFDERKNGGESITNHFKYETDGWKLEQIMNKSQG